MRVFLGLGSNLGDREMNLVIAKDLLMKASVPVVAQSGVLETKPLGGRDQPMYLNQVVECQTQLEPEELLWVCKSIEKEMGRPVEMPGIGNVRFVKADSASPKKGQTGLRPADSRIIDIDILFYDDLVLETAQLIIPHPGIPERDFVIAGVLELDPNFIHPGLKKPLKELRALS